MRLPSGEGLGVGFSETELGAQSAEQELNDVEFVSVFMDREFFTESCQFGN